MALVFVHHVVGDLTVGKPDLAEFAETETLEAAARAIADCAEGAITVWRPRTPAEEARPAERFVGMLNSLDVVAFLARSGAGADHERVMRTTPVADVVVRNPGLLREVDPGTRLIDALEMMKQGVRRLLIRKSVTWKGMSKRFSVLYNGKWLKNAAETSSKGDSSATSNSSTQPSSSSCRLPDDENFAASHVKTLSDSLSAASVLSPPSPYPPFPPLVPSTCSTPTSLLLPLQSKPPTRSPRSMCYCRRRNKPRRVHKIIGDISAYKLWKCDYLAAAWAMANLSAGQFVIGADENGSPAPITLPDFGISPSFDETGARVLRG
uniref:CBS domain-containing protein CBSX6 n=1 Tax=Ananas comosus var. bracteatus TaxID=296719 RepID=A0A6V7QZ58_ANACO